MLSENTFCVFAKQLLLLFEIRLLVLFVYTIIIIWVGTKQYNILLLLLPWLHTLVRFPITIWHVPHIIIITQMLNSFSLFLFRHLSLIGFHCKHFFYFIFLTKQLFIQYTIIILYYIIFTYVNCYRQSVEY